MFRCLTIMVMLTLITAGMIAWAVSPSSAAGCSAPFTKVGGAVSKDMGNLLGGTHVWRTEARTQDCAGYDLVDYYSARLMKESGRCSNGYIRHINNYDFNPNSLGGYNGRTRTVDCYTGRTVYLVTYNPRGSIRIDANDSESERCLGFTMQIDQGPAINDYNGRIPSVCWNGR